MGTEKAYNVCPKILIKRNNSTYTSIEDGYMPIKFITSTSCPKDTIFMISKLDDNLTLQENRIISVKIKPVEL